jgi:hypothetical protein
VQYKDLLRVAVLLVAATATGLVAIAAIRINATGDDLLAGVSLAWWLIAAGLGVWLGTADRAADALAGPLASARTSTTLPSASPARIGLARLWPILAFAVVVGAAGLLWPQVPAIAAGFALLVALAWRSREGTVTAIEDRDGICFYVEEGSAFEPVKLIRTPGLRRGRVESIHPPPPPPG